MTRPAPAPRTATVTCFRCGDRLALEELTGHLYEALREALEGLRADGYQQRYNGRPSCPFCDNFVDDEETHEPGCVLLALPAERPAAASGLREAAKEVVRARQDCIDALNGQGHPGEPHDEMLRYGADPSAGTVGDCSRCGGAQYGSEDTFDHALNELAALAAAEGQSK